MSDLSIEQAIDELRDLVRCRCHSGFTDRGLHDPDCDCDSAEAVEILARTLLAVQPDAVIRAERDRCIRIVEQLQKEAAERGWGDRDTQTRRIVSAIRHEIVGEGLPAVQPVTVRLVFNNADAMPKTTVLDVSAEAVPDIMAWYGAYCSGDRYTVTVDGRNVPMDQNGEPAHVNETPKSEHDGRVMLTPATKGGDA